MCHAPCPAPAAAVWVDESFSRLDTLTRPLQRVGLIIATQIDDYGGEHPPDLEFALRRHCDSQARAGLDGRSSHAERRC